MRRCEIPDERPHQRPIVQHLQEAGFELAPGAYGLWLGSYPLVVRFVIYQAESPQENAMLERYGEALGLLRLVVGPRAVAYGEGRRSHA